MATATAINTGKLIGRRELHFQTIDEMLADLDSLDSAEKSGKLRQLGNWTLGQAAGHWAAWTNYPYDGYPMKVPFFVKLIIRPMKKRFLIGPMPAGKHLPKVAGGTFAKEVLPTDEGIARMKQAALRLKTKAPTAPNPIFGPLTHDEWLALNLRHAELHFSFFRAE